MARERPPTVVYTTDTWPESRSGMTGCRAGSPSSTVLCKTDRSQPGTGFFKDPSRLTVRGSVAAVVNGETLDLADERLDTRDVLHAAKRAE